MFPSVNVKLLAPVVVPSVPLTVAYTVNVCEVPLVIVNGVEAPNVKALVTDVPPDINPLFVGALDNVFPFASYKYKEDPATEAVDPPIVTVNGICSTLMSPVAPAATVKVPICCAPSINVPAPLVVVIETVGTDETNTSVDVIAEIAEASAPVPVHPDPVQTTDVPLLYVN